MMSDVEHLFMFVGHQNRFFMFQIVVLENTLESLLDSKIKLVNPKGN